jgi:hypothetical protein
MLENEKPIFEAAKTQLSAFASRLLGAGFAFEGPEHEVWKAGEAEYTSELRVKLFRRGNIDDVLEFHVYRDGELLVTPEEVSEWFEHELNQKLESR